MFQLLRCTLPCCQSGFFHRGLRPANPHEGAVRVKPKSVQGASTVSHASLCKTMKMIVNCWSPITFLFSWLLFRFVFIYSVFQNVKGQRNVPASTLFSSDVNRIQHILFCFPIIFHLADFTRCLTLNARSWALTINQDSRRAFFQSHWWKGAQWLRSPERATVAFGRQELSAI